VPTVLIADDDPDHREMMAVALRRAGHEVVAAGDGVAAMAALRGGGVDAALIDVRMPGENGVELCRRLRREPGTTLLPVMLISADISDRPLLEALHAGADDFLTKPFHRAELCARLDNLLLRGPGAARKSARATAVAALAARNAMRPAAPGGITYGRTA
jgi:DNA-binding response OmpR family regulator